jgi:predicted secreted protein
LQRLSARVGYLHQSRLRHLPEGKIYLNAPSEMKVGDRRVVAARVGINVSDDVLVQPARSGDQSAAATAGVSHEMIAALNGAGFSIDSITPEKQTVADGFPTVWEWEIKAQQNGVQELEATLYALRNIGSGSTPHRVASYTKKINVSVKGQTWNEWIKSLSEGIDRIKALAVAIGGATTVTLGWFGVLLTRREGRRRATPRVPRRRAASPGSKAA